MEKSLTLAIGNALKETFEGSKVFSKTIEQGLSDGDFLIDIKSISSAFVPFDMIKRTIEFAITAFTSKELLKKLDVLINMENALEVIECENLKHRAIFNGSEIGEDNVVIYPKYTFYMTSTETNDESNILMESLTLNS
ncbi:MAG: hypothetical protein R3Y35_02430 [Clostridia bacterium]